LSPEPPVPVSASYVTATRVLTIVFSGPLMTVGGTDPAELFRAPASLLRRYGETALNVAANVVTVTLNATGSADNAPQGAGYIGAWLFGTNGLQVAPFDGLLAPAV
jgi:hypothetical protein